MGNAIQRVLIVEDDDALRDALRDMLDGEGFHTETAANGVEALTALRRDPKPCLVLADLMMPVMNGWELFSAMESDPDLRQHPVVFVSAFPGSAAPAGVPHLSKPIDLDHLLRTVRGLCGAGS